MCLALIACATNSSTKEVSTITVSSEGKTFEEAKLKGFEKAVEITVGTVILSYSETRGKKLVKDEIISHSSGYVENYKILQRIDIDKVHLTMEVTVKNSIIAQRLLGAQNGTGEIDGDQFRTQHQTYLKQKETGDKVIESVLQDFPKYAFVIEKSTVKNKVNIHRSPVMSIEYSIKYNHKYIEALIEALNVVADKKDNTLLQEKIEVVYKKPSDFLLGKTHSFYFNDIPRSRFIKGVFGQRLYLNVIFKNSYGEVIKSGCDDGKFWNSMNPVNPYTIDANNTMSGEMIVTFNKNPEKIAYFHEIELKLDTVQCTIID